MPVVTTVDATWMNNASVSYTAQEIRRADAAMFNGDGTAFAVYGGIVRHGDLSLTCVVNASDVVTVRAGAVVIPGDVGANGCYRCASFANRTATLDARNATNPRIDLVVFRALDTDVVAGHGAYTGQIEIITGVAAASPAAPALPSMAVELCRINVPASGGGNATIDNSFRTYCTSIGGRLAVGSAARLPTTETKYDVAVAIDTGQEYRWDGTTWQPIVSVRHQAAGNLLDATGNTAPSNPVGLQIITGRVAVTTNSSGVGSAVFPSAFPNGVLSVSLTTLSGSAVAPVINGGAVSKTGFTFLINGAATVAVVVGYTAIGY